MRTNGEKHVWWAIAMPASDLAYSLDLPLSERKSYLNWLRRRGQRLLAQCSTQAQAQRTVKAWLDCHEPAAVGQRAVRPRLSTGVLKAQGRFGD